VVALVDEVVIEGAAEEILIATTAAVRVTWHVNVRNQGKNEVVAAAVVVVGNVTSAVIPVTLPVTAPTKISSCVCMLAEQCTRYRGLVH